MTRKAGDLNVPLSKWSHPHHNSVPVHSCAFQLGKQQYENYVLLSQAICDSKGADLLHEVMDMATSIKGREIYCRHL